jgi:hypothetical protein
MRIFRLKAFGRFQRRERIGDAMLTKAARDVGRGLADADLGGGLIKQRVARPGQGKSGGYRTIIAYRRGERAVFLFGFAKSERHNVDDDELADWRKQGRAWLDLSDERIETAIADRDLQEVPHDEADE